MNINVIKDIKKIMLIIYDIKDIKGTYANLR